ncbi:CoA-binding protein [Paremcibacter congregatus]|uniref:CoA-binding protein n=1 Tax=Paremcibacter congregatus TaxID=2043170 RepID=UPI003A915C51|tara:strand:+ start:1662 stop:2084 length:423 start_codon:yes stop_codon:yes gene_type:complete
MSTSDKDIKTILETTRTIALIGASSKPERPAHRVMKFLMAQGYDVYPVNPGLAGTELLGREVYQTLSDIPVKIDMVDIFRNPDSVGPIVEEAIKKPVKTVWMQLGVINEAAASAARAAGLQVVMDHCPAIEIPRLGLKKT